MPSDEWLRPHLLRRDCPTGSRLVRLKDVSLEDRLAAYQRLVPHLTCVEDAEYLLSLALDPGEKGARVA